MSASGRFLPFASSARLVKSDANGGQRQCNWAVKCDAITHVEEPGKPVALPDTGSFSTYAERAIGPWAGFTIGWLYWWFWVLVLPLEANVAGIILHAWFPVIPVWGFALALTALLTLSNLFDVRSYGEFEFWFGLIKVVAIIGFIAIGGLAIFNLLPDSQVHGLAALTPPGGFMPNGFGAVLAAMLSTMFIFLGAEIVTLAASESARGCRTSVRAENVAFPMVDAWRDCLRARSTGLDDDSTGSSSRGRGNCGARLPDSFDRGVPSVGVYKSESCTRTS